MDKGAKRRYGAKLAAPPGSWGFGGACAWGLFGEWDVPRLSSRRRTNVLFGTLTFQGDQPMSFILLSRIFFWQCQATSLVEFFHCLPGTLQTRFLSMSTLNVGLVASVEGPVHGSMLSSNLCSPTPYLDLSWQTSMSRDMDKCLSRDKCFLGIKLPPTWLKSRSRNCCFGLGTLPGDAQGLLMAVFGEPNGSATD